MRLVVQSKNLHTESSNMWQSDKAVLIVEDEEQDSQRIRLAFMKSTAWRPMRVVRDGQEAMEYLRGFGKYRDRSRYPFPCFMIVDLTLPRMSGFQLLGWLKAQREFDEVPRVVLTASNEERDLKLAGELGCRCYFVKADGLDELVEVSRVLGSLGARDAVAAYPGCEAQFPGPVLGIKPEGRASRQETL